MTVSSQPAMASPWRAVMTALAAVLLALAEFGGAYALAGVLVLLGGAFAVGWPILVGSPVARSSAVVIGAAVLGSLAVVVWDGSPALLSLVVAFGVIGAFLEQMIRSDGRGSLVESVSTTVTGVVVVTSASGWVLALADFAGDETAITALAVLVLASAITALPIRTLLVAGIAAVLGAALGLALGEFLPNLSYFMGAIVGLVAGGMMALTHLVLGGFPAASRWTSAMAAALLPLLVLGIPIHLVTALAS